MILGITEKLDLSVVLQAASQQTLQDQVSSRMKTVQCLWGLYHTEVTSMSGYLQCEWGSFIYRIWPHRPVCCQTMAGNWDFCGTDGCSWSGISDMWVCGPWWNHQLSCGSYSDHFSLLAWWLFSPVLLLLALIECCLPGVSSSRPIPVLVGFSQMDAYGGWNLVLYPNEVFDNQFNF